MRWCRRLYRRLFRRYTRQSRHKPYRSPLSDREYRIWLEITREGW